MKDFHDKLVLITGAASGIGRATAQLFSREGAELALVDIDGARLEETAGAVETAGGTAHPYCIDVRDGGQVEALRRRLIAEAGVPDVLMNCAGVAHVGCIDAISMADWRWVLDVNLWGYINIIHHFLPDLFHRGSGYVINVASGAGLFAVPYQAAYSISKFAVMGLTESIRIEGARHNVGASVVCPGIIHTPIIADARLDGFKRTVVDNAYRFAASPDSTAAAILRGVRRDRAVIMHPFYIRVLYGLKRFFPRAADILARQVGRAFYHQYRIR